MKAGALAARSNICRGSARRTTGRASGGGAARRKAGWCSQMSRQRAAGGAAGAGLGAEATSLRQESDGPPPDRLALLDCILAEAEARYAAWQQGGYAAVWQEWRAALATLGTRVRVDLGDGALLEGEALRVE